MVQRSYDSQHDDVSAIGCSTPTCVPLEFNAPLNITVENHFSCSFAMSISIWRLNSYSVCIGYHSLHWCCVPIFACFKVLSEWTHMHTETYTWHLLPAINLLGELGSADNKLLILLVVLNLLLSVRTLGLYVTIPPQFWRHATSSLIIACSESSQLTQ